MATWDNKAFDLESKKLAEYFIASQGQNGSSLNDLLEKSARENSLNPEQIRRLTRITNIKTWEEKFAGLKTAGADDRNVEFDLGNDDEVIRRLNLAAEEKLTQNTETKTASFPDLDDDTFDDKYPGLKEAKFFGDVKIEKTAAIKLDLEMPFHRLLKMAKDLEVKIAKEKQTFVDSLQAIVDSSKKYTWNKEAQDNFEASAVVLEGMHILPELNFLRRFRKESALELTQEKIGQLKNYILPKETFEIRLLKAASDARQRHQTYQQAYGNMTRDIDKLKSQIGQSA